MGPRMISGCIALETMVSVFVSWLQPMQRLPLLQQCSVWVHSRQPSVSRVSRSMLESITTLVCIISRHQNENCVGDQYMDILWPCSFQWWSP